MQLETQSGAQLWFSPWLNSHESWAVGEARVFSFVTRRLTYSTWCQVLSMPKSPPPWLLAPVQTIDFPLPLPDQSAAMACFVGAVIWSGTPGFADAWVENKSVLLSMMDVRWWREALRLQATRPLCVHIGSDQQVKSAFDLQCLGVSGLLASTEPQWPGLWSRLRLRFSKDLVTGVEELAVFKNSALMPQDAKQLMAAWRLASHLVCALQDSA